MMTEQAKHTPGPWSWDEDFNNLDPIWEMGMSQGDGYIDWKDWLSQKQRANASLIAAAPDLLEALELALTAMNYMGDQLNAMDAATADDVAAVTPAFNAARAAIAKAKGGVE